MNNNQRDDIEVVTLSEQVLEIQNSEQAEIIKYFLLFHFRKTKHNHTICCRICNFDKRVNSVVLFINCKLGLDICEKHYLD
jgi:hypothetical protein